MRFELVLIWLLSGVFGVLACALLFVEQCKEALEKNEQIQKPEM